MANVCGAIFFHVRKSIRRGGEEVGVWLLDILLANEPSNKLIIGRLAIFFLPAN